MTVYVNVFWERCTFHVHKDFLRSTGGPPPARELRSGPNANKSGSVKALKSVVEECLEFELTMP